MGYGVIGSPTGSGPVSLGSSPGTPAEAASLHRPLAISLFTRSAGPGDEPRGFRYSSALPISQFTACWSGGRPEPPGRFRYSSAFGRFRVYPQCWSGDDPEPRAAFATHRPLADFAVYPQCWSGGRPRNPPGRHTLVAWLVFGGLVPLVSGGTPPERAGRSLAAAEGLLAVWLRPTRRPGVGGLRPTLPSSCTSPSACAALRPARRRSLAPGGVPSRKEPGAP